MKNVIGVDIGGTTIVCGRIVNNAIEKLDIADTQANYGGAITIGVLKRSIGQLITPDTLAIGIGVPSVVDGEKGIVYNVQNINGWDEVHLKKKLEKEFNIPVYIDNDANCFSIGERVFGKGKEYLHFVGITLGTGVGGGIVQNGHLLKDANCGSGEFGELPYLDSKLEVYCGSRFFSKYGKVSGYKAALQAEKGDAYSIDIFKEYGRHLSMLVKMIMLTIDPQAIIFGGSITKSFKFFEKSLYEGLIDFPYPNSVKNLKILTSELEHSGVLGAGALCMEKLSFD